jgi:hypothetical protein
MGKPDEQSALLADAIEQSGVAREFDENFLEQITRVRLVPCEIDEKGIKRLGVFAVKPYNFISTGHFHNDARAEGICLAGKWIFTLARTLKPEKILCVRDAFVVFWFQLVPPPIKKSPRQRVLAQWRGVDLAPLEAARAMHARSAATVLPKLMKDLRMDDRRAEAELVKVWNSLLDPNITAHAQPHNLHKGTLFVNVDSSVWLTEIVRYRRKEILDRLQYGYGKNLIRKISFRIG